MDNTNSKFFLINIESYVGSNERKANWSKEALKELGVKESDLETVRTALTADILGKEALRPFAKLRKRVQDYLSSKGERHPLVGWLINPHEREEVIQKMEEIRQEYLAEKANFIASYAEACVAQQERLKQVAEDRGIDPQPLLEALREKQPDVGYYEAHMQFEYFDSTLEVDSNTWREQVKKIENDLRWKTIKWVENEAQEIALQERPSTRVKNLIKVGEKLKSMSFYIPTLQGQGEQLHESALGGVKPSSFYSQQEAIMSIRLAKEIGRNAELIVDGKTNVGLLIEEAKQHAELIIREEEEQQLAATLPLDASEDAADTNADTTDVVEAEVKDGADDAEDDAAAAGTASGTGFSNVGLLNF